MDAAIIELCLSLTYTDTLQRIQVCGKRACRFLLNGGRLGNIYNNNCKDLCRACYDAIVDARERSTKVPTTTTVPATTAVPTTIPGTGLDPTATSIIIAVIIPIVVIVVFVIGAYCYKKKVSGSNQSSERTSMEDVEAPEEQSKPLVKGSNGKPTIPDFCDGDNRNQIRRQAEEDDTPTFPARPEDDLGAIGGKVMEPVTDDIKPPIDVLPDPHGPSDVVMI